MGDTSRMSRETHVRICEGLGVKFPGPTRHYFRVGHASRCFAMVKRWVEKKVRRHLVRARKGKGHGWTRWSSEWLYERLGLFNEYRLYRWSGTKAVPARYVT